MHREESRQGTLNRARGELAPVKSEVDRKQGSEREGYEADGGEGVAKTAPVAGPEIEHAGGDKGECDCIKMAAVVQMIHAAACMEVPGMPGRPAARAIPVRRR